MKTKLIVIALLLFIALAVYLFSEARILPADVPTKATAIEIDEQPTAVADSETLAEPLQRTYMPDDDPSGLFSDVPDSEIDHQAIEALLERAPAIAYAVVRFNSDLMRTYIRDPLQHPSFRFEALGLEPVTLVMNKRSKEHSTGWQSGLATWTGDVEGDDSGGGLFVIAYDGTVSGHVHTYRDGQMHKIIIDPIKGTNQQLMWYVDPAYRSFAPR